MAEDFIGKKRDLKLIQTAFFMEKKFSGKFQSTEKKVENNNEGLWNVHICILRNYTRKSPFWRKENGKKIYSTHSHTSRRPLIKVKYQSAHDKTYQKMSHSHIPQIQKPEKNSLKSLCMVYLERGEKKVINIPFFMSLSERNHNWLFCWVASFFFRVYIF